MTAREDAIEAGARALAANWGDAVWAVLDAVEPIIRADERERMVDLARKVQGGGIRDYEAEVRERIAQEIEAASERLTAEGYDTEGFDYCAAIARIARGDS